MKKLIVLLIIATSFIFISANSVTSGNNHEIATVDTDPGSSGFFTRQVNIVDQISFFVTGSGSMTVTLQFQPPGITTWTDYATYTTDTRVTIDDASKSVKWRAGVKETADYSSGSKSFGFDW